MSNLRLRAALGLIGWVFRRLPAADVRELRHDFEQKLTSGLIAQGLDVSTIAYRWQGCDSLPTVTINGKHIDLAGVAND